jgi:hypothetical protein
LEVDDSHKDSESGDEVHHIRQVLTVESFFQSSRLVTLGKQQMKETNDSAFEFRTSAGVYGRRRKHLPNNTLTDIRRNKQ